MSRLRVAAGLPFRSLRVPNYRRFFLGQVVSLTGTWMQSVGQAWLVLKLTGSGFALGLTVALQFLPMLLAGPWGGVVADRFDKRRLLVMTQSAAGSLALVLGVLTVTGAVRLWMVYVLALLLGLVNLIDMPARQSFVVELVGLEDVANAVSLNSVLVNGTRVAGPALAGVLIATVGTGLCFLLNAASYVAVVIALATMDRGTLRSAPPVARRKGQLREGFRYVWSNRELRNPLLVMAVIGTLTYNFSVVLPLMARFTFHAGAGAYGALFALMGAGAVLGGLVVAARSRATERLLAASALSFGAMVALAAVAPSLRWELAAMVPVGAASTAFIATANSILQLGASPEMRGRVLALFGVVFVGSTPVGGPLVGWIAEQFGPRASLGVGAVAALLAGSVAAVVLVRARRRQTFVNRIGGDVGCELPPAGSTLTARATNDRPSVTGATTDPPRGTNVPAGSIGAPAAGWNQSS
jgi:MFS family permease